MNILQKISRLKDDGGSLVDDLKHLGDELRSENVREELGHSPVLIIEECSRFLVKNDDLAIESARVLVNFTADSDKNRLAVLSNTKLVSVIKNVLLEGPDPILKSRITILLTQFLHNTKLKEDYMHILYNEQFADILLDNLDKNEVILDSQLEILAEIVASVSASIVKDHKWQQRSVERVNQLLSIYKEYEDNGDDNSILLHSTSLLHSLTIFETDPGFSQTNIPIEIISLISKVPNIDNATMIRRRLFGICGNLSSMVGFDHMKFSNTIVRLFLESEDPYTASACAVDLGNTVTNRETKKKFLASINLQDFLDKFFTVSFNEVIQFQALHVLNNLMSEQMANGILLNHYDAVQRISKTIVDNGQYYQEVLAILMKFLVKLVRNQLLSSLEQYQHLWFDIERCESTIDVEILFAVLGQAEYRNGNYNSSNYHRKILVHLMSYIQNAPTIYYEEKIKSLGMYVTKFGLQNLDLESYEKLLTNLSEANFPEPSVCANNLKFLAAKTIEATQESTAVNGIAHTCRKLVAKPPGY